MVCDTSWTICKSFAPRSRPITTPAPHHSFFTGGMPFLPPNQQRQSTPSNTPIPRPTQLTTPNGIRIQSAILPQYTFRTDRLTDAWDTRSKGVFQYRLRSVVLIESDALKTMKRCWIGRRATLCIIASASFGGRGGRLPFSPMEVS